MVAFLRRQRLILPLAPSLAGLAALVTAVTFALLPESLLDPLVMASGLPAILPAAEPPLGATARAVLVLLGGGFVALVGGAALFLAVGRRAVVLGRRAADVERADTVPVLRRADAHPDAPARAPIFAARDLGAPCRPAAPQEAPLPDDLDQPLAAFDPGAIPDVPHEPRRVLPALVVVPAATEALAPGERLETFALTPPSVVHAMPPRPDVAAPSVADTDATVQALLERLERSVAAHGRPSPPVRAAAPRHEPVSRPIRRAPADAAIGTAY